MTLALYENALQVVPLLLIALFLDQRNPDADVPPAARKWQRLSNKFTTLLSAGAFLISLLVVAETLPPSSLTLAIVISAVAGAIGLLCAQIWQRFDSPRARP